MKKGQLTLYMILGIVLLLSIGVMFYYIQKSDNSDDVSKPVIVDVPVKAQPLNSYVLECLKKTSIDGLEQIGLKGGYYNVSNFLFNRFDQTSSDGVTFGNLNVPYWWYMSSFNDCKSCHFASLRLPLKQTSVKKTSVKQTSNLANLGNSRSTDSRSIESELEDYIDDKLKFCLKQKDFQSMGFKDVNLGKPKADVDIRSKDILIRLDMPVSANLDGNNFKLDKFYSLVDLDIKRLYLVASEIVSLEQNFSFFERQTMNIISAFSMNFDENRLPPISESRFSPDSYKLWYKTQTKQRLKEILMDYVPVFNVYGSDNSRMVKSDDDIYQGIYRTFVIPSDINLSGVDVNFIYLGWPGFFDITGRGVNGEIIGPESGFMAFFSWLGMYRYNFYYDVSYPVIVEIFDKDAFDGKGYRFMFAFEVNVRDNEALNVSSKASVATPLEGSMFCNHNQRNSGNISFDVVDESGNPVDGVQVLYSCGAETCFAGIVKNTSFMRLPICQGGVLVFEKQGFFRTRYMLSTKPNKADEVHVVLQKKIKVNISVLKKELVRTEDEWNLVDNEKPLLDNEYAIIEFRSIPDNDQESYSTFALYHGYENSVSVELIRGIYDVDINLIYSLPSSYQEKIIIPEEERCEGGTIFTGCEKIIIPKIEFNSSFVELGVMLHANASINENASGGSHAWKLSGAWDASSLEENDTVRFIAIGNGGLVKNSLVHADMDSFGKTKYYSEKYRNLVEPEILRNS